MNPPVGMVAMPCASELPNSISAICRSTGSGALHHASMEYGKCFGASHTLSRSRRCVAISMRNPRCCALSVRCTRYTIRRSAGSDVARLVMRVSVKTERWRPLVSRNAVCHSGTGVAFPSSGRGCGFMTASACRSKVTCGSADDDAAVFNSGSSVPWVSSTRSSAHRCLQAPCSCPCGQVHPRCSRPGRGRRNTPYARVPCTAAVAAPASTCSRVSTVGSMYASPRSRTSGGKHCSSKTGIMTSEV